MLKHLNENVNINVLKMQFLTPRHKIILGALTCKNQER